MRFKQKLDKFIWFMIYTIPFWAGAFMALANVGNAAGVKFTDVQSVVMQILPTDGIIYNSLINLLTYLTNITPIVQLACGYITYLIIMHFAYIVELIFTFFVHLVEKLFERSTDV